jgi:3-dehydroquinate synthase
MVDSLASEALVIVSHRGPYTVRFEERPFSGLGDLDPASTHYVVDALVADLWSEDLASVVGSPSVLSIEATEPAKSLERFSPYVERLVSNGVRRGHVLVAIGGGIIQDITCFLAATLLRGLEWRFYPTTLLAQADSCIGSKSSINVGELKNALGTFTPPTAVNISAAVLSTLSDVDVRSGVGEMLKVHAIAGPAAFDAIAEDYNVILSDRRVMERYIRRSLELKKSLVEEDEFDRGPRNVMNYGHSFGHAIESATDFAVPHGIAVTIGMDMANFVAVGLGYSDRDHFEHMHSTLRINYAGFADVGVPVDRLLDALGKDKKNLGAELRLVLPMADSRPALVTVPSDERFRALCAAYLARERDA